MATTLAQAKLNTQDDIAYEVIDEFQKQDALLDALTFDDTATPGTGGGSLTYGWTMLATERGAGTRDFNAEASKAAATRVRKSADLLPFAAAYELDRVLANLGPAASSEVTLQTQQAIKSVRAAVADSLVNGATSLDGSFDGLDALLTGSSTEFTFANGDGSDWSSISNEDGAHDAIDALDAMLSALDGDPTFILTNDKGVQKLRSIARRAGYYTRERDEFGRQVEAYAGVPFVDLKAKAGSSAKVIGTHSADIDGSAGGANDTATWIYAVRLGLDGFHGASMAGAPLVSAFPPDFNSSGAVKTGEVEMGPVAPVLKATKAAARLEIGLSVDPS